MLGFLKEMSLKRSFWLLFILSGLALEGVALYFQHNMGLSPCVMCIYERIALFGICIAGVVGLIAPRFLLLRLLALFIAIFCAFKGLMLAIKHANYQFNPSPWNQCPIKVDFPPTLPLNQWFPNIFEATGSCSEIQWKLLTFSMPQWLIAVFGCYLFIFALITLSQFKKSRKKDELIFG